MDPELAKLTQPNARLCGWTRQAVDELVEVRQRAAAGQIGIHEWTATAQRLRDGRPEPDTPAAHALRDRVLVALRATDVLEARDEWRALVDLYGRLIALLDPIPTAASIDAEMDKLLEPPDGDVTGPARSEMREARNQRGRLLSRWRRELEAGVDEPSIHITDADRAELGDMTGKHLFRVAVAVARSGHRPLRGMTRRILEQELTSPRHTRTTPQDLALVLAEWLCQATEEEPTAVDDPVEHAYRVVAGLGAVSHNLARYQLRSAAEELAGDEAARLFRNLGQRPTRTRLYNYGGWHPTEVRSIIDSADDQLQADIAAHDDATPTPDTAGLSTRLADVDPATRYGAVVLLGHTDAPNAESPPGNRRVGERPPIDVLSVPHPDRWLWDWWAAHVLQHPDRAATCLDPDYLRAELGQASAVLTERVLVAGNPVGWTRGLLALVSDRARLPRRVVALGPRRAAEPSPLSAFVVPSATRRRVTKTYTWAAPDERVEEVYEVPHVVAEALAVTGLGADLGRASQVSAAMREAYLDQDPAVWSGTRLARARRPPQIRAVKDADS